jgi:tetratricopeptide (TPR) repeat protein
MAQPVNPYVAGAPREGGRGFFGRQETIEWIARGLRNPDNNSLVLFGQRRIGKTSLLRQLQRTLPDTAFLPIYFDLQGQVARPLREVLIDLANVLAERAGTPPPEPNAFDDRGLFFCRTFLPQVYEALGKDRRPVFLLDEFDVLHEMEEAELPATAAIHSFRRFIRRMMGQDTRSAFVFTIGRRIGDISLDYTAAFRASLVREVWILDPRSAEAMVRQAEANNTLRFTSQAVGRILSLTNGHPYLTKLLCQVLWERAYTRKRTTTPRIGVPEVEAAVPTALEELDHTMVWLWDGLSLAERIYAAGLAETVEEGEVISEERGLQVLADHAARLCTRDVELRAPRDLVRRRILDLTDDQEHRFAIELFRRWVRHNRPLHSVKEELDRVDPLAHELFGIGQEFLRRNQWKTAIRYFRDALAANPHHFDARLRLGETLLQLGRTDEAVVELEWAYEQDRLETRILLTRALVAQAGQWESKGKAREALAACEQALRISPDDRTAQNMRTTILVHRWEVEGRSHERATRWAEAIATYEKLLDQAPAEDKDRRERWQQSLDRCRKELSLARLFREGQRALEKEDWRRAQRALSEVVYGRPGYEMDDQLAVRLLLHAVLQKPIGKHTSLTTALLVFACLVLAVGGWYFLSRREIAGTPPVTLPDNWEHVRTYRLDANHDNQPEWIVLYRFDLPAEEQYDVAPIAGVVYQPGENASSLIPHRLLLSDDEYLCEHECAVTMDNILSGLPGDELIVYDSYNGKVTKLSIFAWNPTEETYRPQGHFSGDHIQTEKNKVTVLQRLSRRAQLALREIYEPRDNKSYYLSESLDILLMPAQYELIFYGATPEDVTLSPYPEKVVLAFYGHYADERQVSEYFTWEGWAEVDRCVSGACGCIVEPREIAHVWVRDLQFNEQKDSNSVSFDADIVCERRSNSDRFEPETTVRWTLVQLDGRWKLNEAKTLP